ncbi:MAG: MEDS domain-containing protein [Candidatus Eremiobacteraeota bacterium]|nr:MEDS domain-containing protein [Candidatus Eremiobacteraeota bacterium]MBV8460114.1 MEDS domain-containing protein [Candidatus Eremiobacteraeota bacterium]MBV8595221.1 MEDS domain-containing protein [Candidatus Eremiobacteraeota bacterium]
MRLKLVEPPQPPTHVVQFYGKHVLSLVRNVAYFLSDGLEYGSAALAITTNSHKTGILSELGQLGIPAADLERNGLLAFLNADETLPKILIDNHPDSDRFDALVGATARQVLSASADGSVRIYGEMAGLLWAQANFSGAMRLEQLGNQLLKEPGYKIFCSYAVDIFGEQFRHDSLTGPLCAHTHVTPTEYGTDLDAAVFNTAADALNVEPSALRNAVQRYRRPEVADMSAAEAAILWLREQQPERAEAIVENIRRDLALT